MHGAVVNTTCDNRPSYKLKSIVRNGRSAIEIDAWDKVLQHAETQARVRAVQMHLNCIITIAALPVSLSCCERRPVLTMSVAMHGLHTDEIEREWIYDTCAAVCLIGW